MMSAKYFEYYTIILRGGAFFRGNTVCVKNIFTFLLKFKKCFLFLLSCVFCC